MNTNSCSNIKRSKLRSTRLGSLASSYKAQLVLDKVSINDAGKGLVGSHLAIDLATNSSLTPKGVSVLLGVRFRLEH